jgi:hypothetical protein
VRGAVTVGLPQQAQTLDDHLAQFHVERRVRFPSVDAPFSARSNWDAADT